MQALYPLKFKTIFKDKIWGGHKIKSVLGKDFAPLHNCGETWELSGVAGNISIVANGPLAGQDLKSLIGLYQADMVGKSVFARFGDEFPLLIKFIDAADDLSIQVHPDDRLAKARHNGFGKTEMWYVLQADPGAKLISGFNRPLDKETYLSYFNSGKLAEILNVEQVKEGDVFYLPAGRVHTIGKGIMIAEIQQTSDITYRIYDFDRVDEKGQKRELHVAQALDAIDFTHYPEYKTTYSDKSNSENLLVKSPFFITHKLILDKPMTIRLGSDPTFRIYICLAGKATIKTQDGETMISKGEVALVPAACHTYELQPDPHTTLLQTQVNTNGQ